MRRHEDYGAVVILDSRLVQKTYGRTFLQSLPPARLLIDSDHEIIESVRRFFENQVANRGLLPRNHGE
jgi:ATP-dependent DNA helicase DinG